MDSTVENLGKPGITWKRNVRPGKPGELIKMVKTIENCKFE